MDTESSSPADKYDEASAQAQAREEQEAALEGDSEEGSEALDEQQLPSQAAAVHERLRIDGEKELERDTFALLWSAIAAGISMSASMMAKGIFHTHLPEGSSAAFFIENLGYTLGFIIVILARQQLFTENTVTAVLPAMSHPTFKNFVCLMRLWGVVLIGNILGAGLAAFTFLHLPMFSTEVSASFVTIGEHVLENTTMEMFSKGIVAGWLIATLVWVLPSVENAKVWVILIVTYVVAIGEFTHIIVGSSEVLYLVFDGRATWGDFLFHFGLPTLAGNIMGGTFIFALISHAQIRNDMDVQRQGKRGAWLYQQRQRNR
ncbi:formate/nitrite transporter family protein [Larsenimonas rhizosphaerae]|uniref:Formate/nitrite transporter family protein n=1 Tax=Larsenimonas rhizosphaerae TaxID=2944682 RepID=A0AA41ZFJ9_9GAMM|nr:formate/nitrite transporter family protein [Larsenimonas rhizosphaerae]MCM2130540.1 formate/nitrite transporter family protein [Larsenimonas rhizosphaerae]MCX2523244.1 formate/nitrite transporter family protein [Larsenimonas rhizosphaerae]